MLRTRLYILLAVVAILAAAVPAYAVKYGEPDNGEHPFVGLVRFYDEAGTYLWRCSGTLIAPKLVLTAAHCTEVEGPARVWFQEKPDTAGYPNAGYVAGRAYPSPWWRGGLYIPDTGDVGVVVLDEAVAIANLPTMAPPGYLDGLATQRGLKDVNFEVVGYGLQSVKPRQSALRERLKAWVQLVNLRSTLTDGYNIQTTNDPGKGTGPGGTCFGDSGGPVFTADNKIVGVNSFVMNYNCAGASFAYRVDRAEVQDWVNSFIE